MVNSYGIKAILKLLWLMCLLGAVVMTVIYLFWFNFDETYFQLLGILLLGYLPFTLGYKHISEKYHMMMLFCNIATVIVLSTMLVPAHTYFIVIFIPLLALLFNEWRIFYVSCITSLVFHYIINYVLNPSMDVNAIQHAFELTLVLLYDVILYLVIRINIKQSTMMYVFDKTVKALILAVEAKDEYTRGHSIRVSEYSLLIGEIVKDNGYDVDLNTLRISSLIHDIGKINIDNRILTKKGKLTLDEYEHIKMHSQLGADIVRDMEYPDTIIADVLHHHERYDGNGYPSGLQDDEIPIHAKIIALADTFDALTSDRPYRSAFTVEEAKKIILDNMRTQFDPVLEDVFISVYPKLVKHYNMQAAIKYKVDKKLTS
ncbi:HD-GYP domain-containing protein [Bacillus sp. HMF5848]|uniref:HD-GYP domain-containing protein n=1 Tax=Bacillus sp. HMF5848 TaxID=2495421 RepID=UPI000F769C5F|nr:HD-GYP domain-containing protein [Bacillus sp. HMF5848]RSK26130.1 HD-GYP domain-containing protein [Bacillus sp. HMF5848]